MSVLGLIVKENRKSLQHPAAASHSQAKNINTTPFCEHDLSCWPNLLQSVLGHVFGSLYFKRKQTTFPLPEICYCWCCRHEESIVRTAFAQHLAVAQKKTSVSTGPRTFWSQRCDAGKTNIAALISRQFMLLIRLKNVGFELCPVSRPSKRTFQHKRAGDLNACPCFTFYFCVALSASLALCISGTCSHLFTLSFHSLLILCILDG